MAPLIDAPALTLDSSVDVICGGCSERLTVNGSLTVYRDGRICTGSPEPHLCSVNVMLGAPTIAFVVRATRRD